MFNSIDIYNMHIWRGGPKLFDRDVSLRLLGKLIISLQHVVTSGRLILREPLTDSNHSQTNVSQTHTPVEASAGRIPRMNLHFTVECIFETYDPGTHMHNTHTHTQVYLSIKALF